MNQIRDLTLPTLLLSSFTVYGFLLVWAQNDTIELSTIGGLGSPMSPLPFNIVGGGNVSIDLSPWRSTSMEPAVTPVSMDSTPTAAPRLTDHTKQHEGSGDPDSTAGGARIPPAASDGRVSPAVTHRPGNSNSNSVPSGMQKSRDTRDFTGRVSIKVKILSRDPQEVAAAMFLQKACEFFQTLPLDDITVTLGPERTPMGCLFRTVV
ncbi:uncharacterized protein [Dendropsophus ebraccatus]|uniref:uncharacterized protein n=1 Tax=Dendropsophus ebraccatus TaxID=150705 RepID=UPI003831BD9E